MITSRKISQVNVFAGSPWEVASVKNLLKAAYIEVSMKENGRNGFLIGFRLIYSGLSADCNGGCNRLVLLSAYCFTTHSPL